ncbi:MAG: sugar ABC transporter ATP-binding protein [Bacillota bacterium]
MAKALEMTNIQKVFPGVVALDDVSFDLEEGEVHALIGENGAGKSTLMKILFGAYRKDSGQIKIRGREVELRGPSDSYRLGIRLIPQELNLVPTLSVMENIFCGRLPENRLRTVNWKELRALSGQVLAQLGLTSLDLKARAGTLSTSEQQLVAIARAFQGSPSVLVFDEPTSALSRDETRSLFEIIRRLKKQNVGIVYITHRLEEVPEIADRVTIMRDGKIVGTATSGEITIPWIIDKMTGLTEEQRYPKVEHEVKDEVVLEVRGIKRGNKVRGVSFAVRQGEILGITGFVGAGKTELARILFGEDIPDEGEILLNGKKLSIRGPSDAIRQGIALIPENRRLEGLVVPRCVDENITVPTLNEITRRGGVLDFQKERQIADHYIKALAIATPSRRQRVKYLSGGNQQKAVVAKWLNAKSKVFIFDEGTRGIDVKAKAEIYRIMGNLAKAGCAVIWISMEFAEVLGVSDRILVMREGRISDEMTSAGAGLDRLYFAAGGRSA